LHGGSGLSEQDFRNCIAGGIQKINIYTDMVYAGIKTAREKSANIDYIDLIKATEDAIYDVVASKIKIFGTDNRA
jgi:fructose-bisphosphate aldolase class II